MEVILTAVGDGRGVAAARAQGVRRAAPEIRERNADARWLHPPRRDTRGTPASTSVGTRGPLEGSCAPPSPGSNFDLRCEQFQVKPIQETEGSSCTTTFHAAQTAGVMGGERQATYEYILGRWLMNDEACAAP